MNFLVNVDNLNIVDSAESQYPFWVLRGGKINTHTHSLLVLPVVLVHEYHRYTTYKHNYKQQHIFSLKQFS
jgi:hypothetical protein